MIRNVKYVVTSALFRLGKPTTGRNYGWLEQVAFDYISERAPLDGQICLKTWYVKITTQARQATLPSDCLRISKIALKSGKRLWTLTVDPNLRIPEELFACDTDEEENAQQGYENSYYGVGWWWGQGSIPTLGGGRNVNYYRIDGRNIIFDHNIHEGELIIEYMSNGDDITTDTLIDMAYAESLRLYLMSEFCLKEGDMGRYKEFQRLHEGAQWNSNILVKAPRMYELIDAVAQSSEFNLG